MATTLRKTASSNGRKSTTSTTTASRTTARVSRVTEDSVRERAYQLFATRGFEHGHDFDDWVEAERQLKSQK